jgi:predicted nucleic-acid-binding protein
VIGLDTNVLVRYIAQDDSEQSPRAAALIESFSSEAPGYVTTVSVVELVWVMQSCYDMTREGIAEVLSQLLRTREIVVENAEVVWRAIRVFGASGADFADCLIERSAANAGCIEVFTFDQSAARHLGMKLVS